MQKGGILMKGLAGSSCGLGKLKVDPTLNRKYIPKTLTMKYLPTILSVLKTSFAVLKLGIPWFP